MEEARGRVLAVVFATRGGLFDLSKFAVGSQAVVTSTVPAITIIRSCSFIVVVLVAIASFVVHAQYGNLRDCSRKGLLVRSKRYPAYTE